MKRMHLKTYENFAPKFIIFASNFQKFSEEGQTPPLTLPPPIPSFWVRHCIYHMPEHTQHHYRLHIKIIPFNSEQIRYLMLFMLVHAVCKSVATDIEKANNSDTIFMNQTNDYRNNIMTSDSLAFSQTPV